MKERLQKLLAQANIASRRTAEEYIEQGRVRVNGVVAKLGDKADPTTDTIELDGDKLKFNQRPIYIAVNKPRNILVTHKAHKTDERDTIIDMIGRKERLFPIGRLDADSEGLVVLTNDGELAQKITHPRFRHTKTYIVDVYGIPDEAALEKWRGGLFIEDERTAPCFVEMTKSGNGIGTLRIIMIDQQEIEAGTLTLSPKWNQPKKKGSFPWAAVLIPLGVILFIVILVKVVSSKPAPTPMPMPIAEVAPAPKPVGPLKTVMIGAGGDAEGFPVVGWIVPLSGPQAYQTFRLLQGVTKIGNAQGVNVVINDGFMTGEHCHIVGSPAGFQLQDNKSTNGSFVNDKRIERHDLVDNDVITLGRTHIVFKSIN